jgi:hypothetical protein
MSESPTTANRVSAFGASASAGFDGSAGGAAATGAEIAAAIEIGPCLSPFAS